MIPASLTATIFPACSALGANKTEELKVLYARSVKYLFWILAPINLILFLFAKQIINLWLGPGFLATSGLVLQILSVGVFVNCFAHVPYCFLQSLGRPELPAKLLAAELIPYVALLLLMIRHWGLAGAAMAWSIRAAIEVLLLLLISKRVFGLSLRPLLNWGTLIGIAALIGVGLAMVGTMARLTRLLPLAFCLNGFWAVIFGLVLWNYVFDDLDRQSFLALLAPVRHFVKGWSTASP